MHFEISYIRHEDFGAKLQNEALTLISPANNKLMIVKHMTFGF